MQPPAGSAKVIDATHLALARVDAEKLAAELVVRNLRDQDLVFEHDAPNQVRTS